MENQRNGGGSTSQQARNRPKRRYQMEKTTLPNEKGVFSLELLLFLQ
jgi:hypothetical protein